MTQQRDRIAELEGRVVRLVRDLAPPGWRRIDLHCLATIAVSDVALTVLTGDGRTVTPADGVPQELTGALLDLRRAHYLSEQGTWFSMTLIVEPGHARPLYNYDFDPEWDPPIPVDCWRRDQIVMPREGAHMPAWLAARLDDREPSGDDGGPVPGPLNPVEQAEVLSGPLSVLVADKAPPLWQKVFGYYQAAGGHVEFPPMMCYKADGTMSTWTPPTAAARVLDRLRAGTHGFQGSTWTRIDFEVLYEDGGVRCRASFTFDDEPQWNAAPSADDVRRELERFPREDVPEWMARLLGPAPAPATRFVPPDGPERRAPGGLRRARIFDRVDPADGRPAVSRPPVPPEEAGPLAEYLSGAPLVMAARSSAPDRLDPSRGDRVPLTFHTDGTWVWSGAVGYYLREHGVPPEPDLVAHARAQGFRVPPVDDDAMDAAGASVTGRDTGASPRTVVEPPPPGPGDTGPRPGDTAPYTAAEALGAYRGTGEAPVPPRTTVEPADVPPAPPRTTVEPADVRPAAPSGPGTRVEEDWAVTLRSRLDDLGIDPGEYRVRGDADGAWCLRYDGGRWAVYRADGGERQGAAAFDDPAQAAAYLLGSLLMTPRRAGPIDPLDGEPPLTLLRDRHRTRLAAGTEVDRYGPPSGNMTYAARTPFARRSLPPDWERRPYHAYRLRRPLEALTGTAVPWFDQPGGGTAYLFARPISALLADGALIEIT